MYNSTSMNATTTQLMLSCQSKIVIQAYKTKAADKSYIVSD